MQSFVKAATWVHEQKKTNFTPSDLQSADVKPLISDLNSVLQASTLKGIEQINHKMPHKMQKDLENNVYVFSGLKTYNELKAVSQLLLDKKGNVKSWHEFQKDILRVHKTYNINYLKAEYQFATTSAQMAAHWGQVEEDGDRYNLQYRTAGDNRVRDSHVPLNNVTLPPSDPFWKEYYPPNGWQCRCTAVQVLKNNYKQSNPKEAMAWGNESTKGPNKIFRFNPGTQKVIFPPHHPYFKDKEAVRVMGDRREEEISRPIMNLKEYIKGDEPTNQEVKNILIKYAELQPDDFRRGLDKISFQKSKSYMMQHSMSYRPSTGEWVGSSSITLSTHDYTMIIDGKFDVFNPARELKEAFGAIKKGDKLTFKQEYSMESLWHEILHAKTKTKPYILDETGGRFMETLNEFCARHTYDKFIAKLGGKAINKNQILEEGMGYKRWISEFRQKLKEFEIDEREAVKELMPKLMSDYGSIGVETRKFLNENKKKK